MKILSRSILILFVLIIAFELIGTASAAGYTNYVTTFVTEEEKAEFFANRKKFEFLTEAEGSYVIESFAVSEKGQIALGFDTSEGILLHVYNTNGQFMYGYCFPGINSAFVVFYEGEDLSIYWAKSGYIGSFDSNGNCIQLCKADPLQNDDAFNNDRNRPSSGKVGDGWYYAEQNVGLSFRYARFVFEDSEGNRQVIYDVTKEHISRVIMSSIFILIFLSLYSVICFYHKKNKNTDDSIML